MWFCGPDSKSSPATWILAAEADYGDPASKTFLTPRADGLCVPAECGQFTRRCDVHYENSESLTFRRRRRLPAWMCKFSNYQMIWLDNVRLLVVACEMQGVCWMWVWFATSIRFRCFWCLIAAVARRRAHGEGPQITWILSRILICFIPLWVHSNLYGLHWM